MLLSITTTHKPATDIGYLLHKSPFRCQTSELSFGSVNVYYPEATEEKCTVAVQLDINPIGLVRGKRKDQSSFQLEQYVNDRPYVCSSYMSVALSRVFGQTLNGTCKKRPELVDTIMPLTCEIATLPSRGGEGFLKRIFEPLGYQVETKGYDLDEKFKEWGMSSYYTARLFKETTLYELLNHLYVLIPVLDNQKHYYIGTSEIEKLVKRGEGWLKDHPEKEFITKRYLRHKSSYIKEALLRLMDANPSDDGKPLDEAETQEESIEKRINLNEERIGTVLSVLKAERASTVIDLGCGEGRLLQALLKDKVFTRITGMDVSIRALEIASERLKLERMPTKARERIELIHGSLMYRDRRISGYDAATVIEVIEHLDTVRLKAFERVVFEASHPPVVVLTTPNREYNIRFENLPPDKLRHADHRFEWTRNEFREWAGGIADKFGYNVRFLGIGDEDEEVGSPTQMAVFKLSGEQN